MENEELSTRAIQAELSRAEASWFAEDNPISELTREQRRKLLGVRPPPGSPTAEDALRRAKTVRAERNVGAPSAFDWRSASGANYITAVRNQGGCGSCVGFGAVAVVEAMLRIQRGTPGLAVDLSEGHLFYCLGQASGASCSGGWWPELALNAFRDTGVSDEACYPYTDTQSDCGGRCADWQARVTQIAGHRAFTGDPAAMKDWIATRGPLSACFVVFDDFFAYRNGVYRHVTGAQAGGHCVAIVGYDDTAGAWICKNSWGAGWGDAGYFKIAYGECGIDTWDVRAVDGVRETGWLNDTRVLGLWTIREDRNAWVYLQTYGWKRVAFDNDNILYDILAQLIAAKSANRPVNVYQVDNVIRQVYIF